MVIYKNIIRLQFNSNDDTLGATVGTYQSTGNNNINSKIYKYLLSGLQYVNISANAKCMLESFHILGVANGFNQYRLLKLNTQTKDITWDSKYSNMSFPVICSSACGPNAVVDYYYNSNPEFNNISINSNFLQKGFIEFSLEYPTANGAINFANVNFSIVLVIMDYDLEETQDNNLNPKINEIGKPFYPLY